MPDAVIRSPILFAILAALATLGLKWTAYAYTGSLGLMADAVESIVNLVAALTAFASIWYASRPVDPSHTYGHEKIEYFSTGLEGVLILVASVSICWYAIGRLLSPQALSAVDVGVAIGSLASVINWVTARYLLRQAKLKDSIILEAEGQHLLTDVATSIGVLGGMGLAWLTSLNWIDPLVALLVGLNITRTGFGLIHRSFDGLMDRSLPEAEQRAVRAAIESKLHEDMDYHALRTRRAGSRRFVDFHLLVPGVLSVQEAHGYGSDIEDAIRAVAPGLEVTVHIEPIEDLAAWEDSQLLPHERAAGLIRTPGPDHASSSGAG
ncbi:cation diffusion facilitator family transporter [soil metagenome]